MTPIRHFVMLALSSLLAANPTVARGDLQSEFLRCIHSFPRTEAIGRKSDEVKFGSTAIDPKEPVVTISVENREHFYVVHKSNVYFVDPSSLSLSTVYEGKTVRGSCLTVQLGDTGTHVFISYHTPFPQTLARPVSRCTTANTTTVGNRTFESYRGKRVEHFTIKGTEKSGTPDANAALTRVLMNRLNAHSGKLTKALAQAKTGTFAPPAGSLQLTGRPMDVAAALRESQSVLEACAQIEDQGFLTVLKATRKTNAELTTLLAGPQGRPGNEFYANPAKVKPVR